MDPSFHFYLNPKRKTSAVWLVAFCLHFGLCIHLYGMTNYWTGSGVDSNWSTANNWNGNTLPLFAAGTNDIMMGQSLQLTNNVDSAIRIKGLTFTNGMASAVIFGSGITISNNGLINRSINQMTVSNNITLVANQTWNSVTGLSLMTGTINVGGNLLNYAGTSNMVFENTISGSGAINKTGTMGSLILLASNAFTASFTNSSTSGYLAVGNAYALGTNVVYLTGAGNGIYATNGPVTLVNTMNISANTTFGGSTNLGFSGIIDLGTGSRSLTFSNFSETAFYGQLTNTAGFTKLGAGNLLITNRNLYTGPTTNTAGVITFSHNDAFGTGPLVLNGGSLIPTNTAIIITNRVDLIANGTVIGGNQNLTFVDDFSVGTTSRTLTNNNSGTLLFAGNITNTAGLTLQGTGTTRITNVNSFQGGLTLTTGTLEIGNNNALGTNVFTVNGASTNLAFGGPIAITNVLSIGSSFVIGGTNNMEYAGVANLGTTKRSITILNTATNIFSGAITNTGGWSISNGIVQLSGSSANTFSGGMLITNVTLLLNKTAGTDAIGNTPLFMTNSTVKWLAGNQINDKTTITNFSSTLDLNGNSDQIGNLILNAATIQTGSGTLTISNITSLADAVGSTVTGLVDLSTTIHTITSSDGSADEDLNISAVISGTGGILKNGSGKLVLTGLNTYSGSNTLSVGTLAIGNNNALGTGDFYILGASSNYAYGGAIAITNQVHLVGSTFIIGTNNMEYAGTLDLGTTRRGIYGINSATNIFSGAITNTGGLAISNGTFMLSGTSANLFTGGLTGTNVTILLNKTAGTDAIGVTAITVTNSTIKWLQSNQLNDRGAVTNYHSTLDLNNNSDQIGNLIIDGGTIQTGSGTLTISNITSIADPTTSTISGNIDLATTIHTLTIADGTVGDDFAIYGIMSGSGGILKNGAGKLVITNVNTYSGSNTLSVGTLAIGNNNALGTGDLYILGGTSNYAYNGAIAFTNTIHLVGNHFIIGTNNMEYAGTLDIGTSKKIIYNTNTGTNIFSGAITNTGGLVLSNGTTRLTGSANNTFTGGLLVSNGTLILDKNVGVNAIGNTFLTLTNSTARWLASDQVDDRMTLTNFSSTVDMNNNSETLGNIVMYEGTIQTGTGTLGISNITTLADANNSSIISGNISLGTLIRTVTVANGAVDEDFRLDGLISGTGGLLKNGAGKLVLTNANNYTGSNTLSAGTLALGNNNALGTGDLYILANTTNYAYGGVIAITNNIHVVGNYLIIGTNSLEYAGTLDLGTTRRSITITGTATNTWSGAVTNTAGFIQLGGTINMSGASANTFTGFGIVSNSGTLMLSKNNGTDAVGNAAGLLLASNSTLRWFGNDQLNNNAMVSNLFSVMDLNGSTDTVGQVVLNGGTIQTGNGQVGVSNLSTYANQTQFSLISGNASIDNFSSFTINSSSLTTDLFVSASLSGTGTMSKSGNGIMVIGGDNNFSGTITNTAGTLQMSSAGSIGGTPQVVVAGGTLLFNVGTTNTSSSVVLRGGTISEIDCNVKVGAFTISANSTIDFLASSGTGRFDFQSGTNTSGTLTIYGWSWNSSLDGGSGDLIFFSDIAATDTSAFLDNITFFGTGGGARILSSGELVPITPEPGTIWGGTMLIALGLKQLRKRLSKTCSL